MEVVGVSQVDNHGNILPALDLGSYENEADLDICEVIIPGPGGAGMRPLEIVSAGFINAGQNVGLPIRIWQIGARFNGASTTAHPPTLSNSNKTAAWTLTNSFITPAVKSSKTVSAGQYFVAAQVNVAGAYNAAATIGFGNASADVNNPASLTGNTAMVGAQTFGANDFEFAGDTAVLGTDVLDDGDVLMTKVDIDAGNWGTRTPDGVDHDNAQAVMGLGGHLLGMPAGPLSVLGFIEAIAISGSPTVALTLLTDAALVGLGLTGPAGYKNIAG